MRMTSTTETTLPSEEPTEHVFIRSKTRDMGASLSKCREDLRKGLEVQKRGFRGRLWWAWDLIFLLVLRIFFRIAHWVVRLFFTIILRSRKGVLKPPNDPVLLKSAVGLAEDIRNRKVTAQAVVQAYVDRIKEVQPYINAVIDERYQSALEEALEVDHYISSCGLSAQQLAQLKPFLGVPITIKGSLACEGLTFSVGSPSRKHLRAEFDAEVVCRMRRAGAIPMCVTNIPPLCVGFSSENPLYGVTWNPYDLRRLAGGSSGGEAALLASAGSVLGLANDLGGSLRIPACLCGVFAHKPTSGTVSSDGFFTVVKNGTEDVLINGPMCRYSEDLLPSLKILVDDQYYLKLGLNRKVELNKIKIYYTDHVIDNPGVKKVCPEVRNEINRVINYFQSVHEAQVEKIHLPYLPHVIDIWQAKLSRTTLIADTGRSFFEIIRELAKCLVGRTEETSIILWRDLNMKLFGKRKERRFSAFKEMGEEIRDLLRHYLEDDDTPSILLFPASPDGAPYRMEEGLELYTLCYYMLFSVLGLPVTQCPLGLNREGLPVGVQVVGGKYRDKVTIAVAREIENGLGGWQPPWKQNNSLTSSL